MAGWGGVLTGGRVLSAPEMVIWARSLLLGEESLLSLFLLS